MSGVAKGCMCVAYHSPSAYVPNLHHIVPLSWGGTDSAPAHPDYAGNRVLLCPNTHTAVHDLLNHYIHTGGEPDWDALQHYNELARQLAAWAWAHRPDDHPPYTTAHPGIEETS